MGIQHRNAEVGQRHSPYNWVFADAAEKDAATPLVEDVYKQAFQVDTGESWVLVNHSPVTWVRAGSPLATDQVPGVVEQATTQEAKDAVAGKFPDAAGVHAAFGQYGLGLSYSEESQLISDFNNNGLSSGTYRWDLDVPANAPPGEEPYGILHILKRNAANRVDITVGQRSEAVHVRNWRGGAPDPWHKIYTQLSILGPVSQSGGVPTGAIIEYGSNANGDYVKLAGGLAIIRSRVASQIFASGNHTLTWDFPIELFGVAVGGMTLTPQYQSVSNDAGKFKTWSVQQTQMGNTNVTFVITMDASTDYDFRPVVQIIARWH